MAGKKGQKWSKSMTTHQRDAIALTKIEKYIDAQIDEQLLCPACGGENKKELSPNAVQLLKVRYDKLRPSLSSVDQTIKEEGPKEEEMAAALAHLLATNSSALRPIIESDPAVRAALASLLGGGPVALDAVSDTQQKAA